MAYEDENDRENASPPPAWGQVLAGYSLDDANPNPGDDALIKGIGAAGSRLETDLGPAAPFKGKITNPAELKPLQLQAVKYFKEHGWSWNQAAGIVANLTRESSLDAGAVGDNRSAYGLAQWHRDRQAAFRRWSGRDIQGSTFEQQLGFVNYELTEGTERAAGVALRQTTNAADAGAAVSELYERPGDKYGEAGRRGALADEISADGNVRVAGETPPKYSGHRRNIGGIKKDQSTQIASTEADGKFAASSPGHPAGKGSGSNLMATLGGGTMSSRGAG